MVSAVTGRIVSGVQGRLPGREATGDKVRGAGQGVEKSIQAEKTAGTEETRSSMLCMKKSQQ